MTTVDLPIPEMPSQNGLHLELTEDSAALDAVFLDIFGKGTPHAPVSAPRPVDPSNAFSDAELIDRTMRADNGPKFRALMAGDTSHYNGDDSSADYALAVIVLWWSQGDEAQTERIMRRSSLEREKWGKKRGNTTYLGLTISNANRRMPSYYTPRAERQNVSAALKRDVPAERNNEEPPMDDAYYADNEPNVSAGTTDASAERKRDIFVTAREVAESTPETPEWAVYPWSAIGSLTEIVGPIKGGKTTWELAKCRAVLDGADFMSYPTMRGPVVYLSEQPSSSFREGLRRANLLERDDFYILFWSDAQNLTWPQKVGAAVLKAQEVGAVLLVVDTLAWWAGLRGDAENSTGAAQEAMEPLIGAVSRNRIAIDLLRHERKAGGEVGQSGRGSSAFGGSVDIVLQLKRPEGNPGASPNMRVIHSLSRYDETPSELMIELTEQGYIAHGDVHAVALTVARNAVTEALKAGKPNEDGQITYALAEVELLAACDSKGVKRSTLQDALQHFMRQFLVKKTGAGKRNDPFRYTWIGD